MNPTNPDDFDAFVDAVSANVAADQQRRDTMPARDYHLSRIRRVAEQTAELAKFKGVPVQLLRDQVAMLGRAVDALEQANQEQL